jgi:hypothetical protein
MIAVLSALASSSLISCETSIPVLWKLVLGTVLFVDPRPDLETPDVPRMLGDLAIPVPVDVAAAAPRNEGEREELAIFDGLDVTFSGVEGPFTTLDIVAVSRPTFENERMRWGPLALQFSEGG